MLRSIRLLLLASCMGMMASAVGLAQDPPPPEGEAMSLDAWSGSIGAMESAQPQATATRSTIDGGGRRPRPIINNGYYSPTLRGHFLAQWMFITVQGRRYEFWGARILNLDYDSPVRQLGVNPGDVITRLDGLPIWRGMTRIGGQAWQLPELENHFGNTEVRYLLRGTNQVRVGEMMLDGTWPDGFDNDSPILP